jgi:cobalt/nickel transport system permease protein
MHIPDGFLSTPVWLALDVAAIPAVGWTARRGQATAALGGVMGAFVFAAQMVNVPLGAGVSGHLLGGALLARTLGARAATLVMTAVVLLQALLFQDGGILALGANLWNMAFVGIAVAHVCGQVLGRGRVAEFGAAFLSVLATGALVLAELALSHAAITGRPLMLASLFLVVTAVLEGVVTIAVLKGIRRLVHLPELNQSAAQMAWPTAAILTFAGILVATSTVASASPDLLQSLASQVRLTETSTFAGLLPTWLPRPIGGFFGIATIYWLWTIGGKQRA